MDQAGQDRVDGFLAASEGLPRDPSKSADWLHGFDGYAIGMANNEAKRVALDAETAHLRNRRKVIRPYHSLTPKTIG